MKQCVRPGIAAVGLVAFFGFACPAQADYPQSVRFLGSLWTTGNFQDLGVRSLREYVTEGETVQSWTQLLSVVRSQGQMTTGTLWNSVRTQFLAQSCPEADLQNLGQTENDLYYLRDYRRCREPSPEINVVRVTNHDGQIIAIVYATRSELDSGEQTEIQEELGRFPLE